MQLCFGVLLQVNYTDTLVMSFQFVYCRVSSSISLSSVWKSWFQSYLEKALPLASYISLMTNLYGNIEYTSVSFLLLL